MASRRLGVHEEKKKAACGAVRSAELRSKHRIPIADSVIATMAQIHGCPLFSDDPHFQEIEILR